MINRTLLLIIFFLLIQIPAKANFDFNSTCTNAYKAILDLRFKEAETLIKLEKSQHPNNGIPILLENYLDFYSLLVSDNKSDYDRLKGLKSERLNRLSKHDKSSPYYLFAQAEVNLQWGVLKGKFKDYVSSALDINKADNLLAENQKKFPQFLPNKKIDAIVNILIGATPSSLRSFLQTFGLDGNINRGITSLEQLVVALPKSSFSFYTDEVIFYLCYLETDFNPNKINYQKIMGFASSMSSTSLLKSYLQGYVAFKNAHNDDAINFFSKAPRNAHYANFKRLDYLLGVCKLSRLDADANVYFLKYLKDFRGNYYVKDAYLKLAHHSLINNDLNRYKTYLHQVKTRGDTDEERDEKALKDANDLPPNVDLLKARYLFDGGYYAKSLSILSSKSFTDFKNSRDQIDFYYQLGRNYDEVSRDNEAIVNYTKCINLGRSSSYYYAANSALMIGNIFAKKGDKAKAASYYKLAISMRDHDYENSIESKAKFGLSKIGY